MITSDIRQDIFERFLGDRKAAERPAIHAMAGIPAAGKSTFVKQAMENGTFPKDSFILAPDDVMHALPAYQGEREKNGPDAAFAKWEMPARALAYEMLEMAVSARMNIIKDMGCVRQENYEKLQAIQRQGYTLNFYYIHCPPEEALQRRHYRQRHTPEGMIIERYEALQTLLPAYYDLADSFFAYDNTDLSHPYQPKKFDI